MAILKKLLFGGIGVVAIAGIATGIGVAINNSAIAESSMNETESKPSEDDKNSSEDDKKDPNFSATQTIDLKKLLAEIQPSNIIFKKKEASIETRRKSALTTAETADNRKDVYAFDVTATELDFDQETKKKLDTNKVEVKIELNNNINNGIELNQGNLNLNLIASLKAEKEAEIKMMQTHQITISGFKASSKELIALFKTQNDASKQSVLELTKPKKSGQTIALTTIENLNKKENSAPKLRVRREIADETVTTTTQTSGLTKLFRMVNTSMQQDPNAQAISDLSNIFISGEVKLNKVSKDQTNENTLFHLVSADAKKQLELINEKTKDKALVNEIVVTNLLATSIKLNLDTYQVSDQTEFLMNYKQQASNKMFESDNEHLSLKIKKTPQTGNDEIVVSILPKLIKRTAKDQELKANLVISYGSNQTLKSYSTTKKADLEELKNAGFSFDIYSKKLEGMDEVISADKITHTDNKIDSFFNKDSISKGIMKSSLEMGQESMKKPIGGFSLISSISVNFNQDFSLGTVSSVMNSNSDRDSDRSLDVPQTKWQNENWISFVGYSFGKGLKDKVLFIPTINIIYITEVKNPSLPMRS